MEMKLLLLKSQPPLEGTLEKGQFASLCGLPRQLKFHSHCLNLSQIKLSAPLLNELATSHAELSQRFNQLKFNHVNLTDDPLKKLHALLFQESFEGIFFDGNQLTSNSLEWLLENLKDTKRKHSASFSFQKNNIQSLEKLVDVFTRTWAPQQERSYSRHVPRTFGVEEQPRYEYSSLRMLDLSGNPSEKEEIFKFLQAFVKQQESSYSSYNSPSYFSWTTVVLKNIASLQGEEVGIRNFLIKNKLAIEVILDEAFMPSPQQN